VHVGLPLEKRSFLTSTPRKGDSWASPPNFCLIRLKETEIKKQKSKKQKLKNKNLKKNNL
jgi:hypothetical protein